MVLNSALARNASTSTLTFDPFIPNPTQPSHLLFYYYIVSNGRDTAAERRDGQTLENSGYLQFSLFTQTEIISSGFLKPRLGGQLWYSACINIPPDTVDAVSLSFSGHGVFAAIDDVSLNPGPCFIGNQALLLGFLAHLSRRLTGELIVCPCSGVRRPSSVGVRRRSQFQRSSPLKPLGQSKPNFMWSILRKGERKFI